MIKGYEHIPIPKNIRLTEQFLKTHQDKIKGLLEFYLSYPDRYIDDITPYGSEFQLFFFQRIFLRACMRFRYHYCVAPRAFSKSFISILAAYLRCMFLPGSKFFICAPRKEQGAKIATEKLNEIWGRFPILLKELSKKNMSKDYVTLIFKNGSIFDVVGALDSTRGGRRHGGIIDEVRDHDGDILSEVVLPLMNVSRRTAKDTIDPTEPNQQQIYITSAGGKGTYAYGKLIEVFEQSILTPNSSFVWGCDYLVPMQHGLLSRDFIEELKYSPTYKEDAFMREYMSLWTGGSEESWIDYDSLGKYRKIVNSEKSQNIIGNKDTFYLISVDVARIGVNTSIQVFKCVPKETHIQKRLVYITTLQGDHFSHQALVIKNLNMKFRPKEIVIDGTGLGVGLLDFLVMDQVGPDGVTYPGLSSSNDEEYRKYAGDKILYVIKASGQLNSDAHNAAFTELANGHVRFLIRESEAKAKLLATAKGGKMNPKKRLERLTPYYQTTRLFEEIANIRVKQGMQASGNTTIEQINRRIPKDRFSAFEYGLLRIKSIEDDYYKKKRHKARDYKQFLFFSKGGG